VVRKLFDLPLHGEAYEGRYVIADVRMKSDFPTERWAFFSPSVMPESTLLVLKGEASEKLLDSYTLNGAGPRWKSSPMQARVPGS
jgi:3-(3-hydroxy-phenyl)propionate hydroxylase